MEVLLMTPAYLKRHNLVDENVDEGYITPIIEVCQDMWVQEILGTDLYEEIKAQIATPPISALNTALLNTKILPAMRWWVAAKLVKPITYRYTNSGVKQIDNENAYTPLAEELDKLTEEYMNRAEYYANRCTMYLIENSTDYPLYENQAAGVDKVHPRRNQFKSSIFLGGVHGKTYKDYIDIDYGDKNCCR
jgi:hypothetical protein